MLGISVYAMPTPVSFRDFKTSREIIQLAVMLYVRFPLSLRNVEDLVHERCVDVSYESVRSWWHRFGSQFARQIKKRSAGGMQSSNWRWRNGQRRDVLACLSDTTGAAHEVLSLHGIAQSLGQRFERPPKCGPDRFAALYPRKPRAYFSVFNFCLG